MAAFLASQVSQQGKADSYAQLLTVLLIFVVVLGATALTTKWIAGYQKEMGKSGNIELLDAVRLGNNKYIQIVRVGETYVALAVCKDTVSVLCEIPEDQIRKGGSAPSGQKLSFQEILARMKPGEAPREENTGAEENRMIKDESDT